MMFGGCECAKFITGDCKEIRIGRYSVFLVEE